MSKSVAVLLPSLRLGGSERSGVWLSEFLCSQGWKVSILSADSVHEARLVPAAGVEVVHLDVRRPRSGMVQKALGFVRRSWRTYRNLSRRNVDSIVAFGYSNNVVAIIVGRIIGARVLISERSDPRQMNPNRFWRLARRLLYRHADVLVLQSLYAQEWAVREFPSVRTVVIPNAVRSLQSTSDLPGPLHSPLRIVMVGRLSRVKNHAFAIDVVSELNARGVACQLYVIGEGEERSRLEEKASRLELRDKVVFLGARAEPFAEPGGFDLLLLCSVHEGFPNVLIEAMSVGLPVVAVRIPGGVAEVLADYGDESWAASEHSVADVVNCIQAATTSSCEIKRRSEAAILVSEKYSEKTIGSLWAHQVSGAV